MNTFMFALKVIRIVDINNCVHTNEHDKLLQLASLYCFAITAIEYKYIA